jgi:hypothetical protein
METKKAESSSAGNCSAKSMLMRKVENTARASQLLLRRLKKMTDLEKKARMKFVPHVRI